VLTLTRAANGDVQALAGVRVVPKLDRQIYEPTAGFLIAWESGFTVNDAESGTDSSHGKRSPRTESRSH
jgi:hypothetical protein